MVYEMRSPREDSGSDLPAGFAQVGSVAAGDRHLFRSGGAGLLPNFIWLKFWLLLLVAEGFDGVEFGGLHGRPDSKEESNTHADDQAGRCSPHWNATMPFQGQANQQYQAVDEDERDDSACASQGHGLEQELPSYVLALGADGFADANLASALSDAHEHDVHYAYATDQQTHGAEHYRG